MNDFLRVNIQNARNNYYNDYFGNTGGVKAASTSTALKAKPVYPVTGANENQLKLRPARISISSKSYPNNNTMYSELYNSLDEESKVLLSNLNKNGVLYSRSSNNNSSALENIYTILKEPRYEGFKPEIIIKETLKIVNDPYIVTQNFGTIPPIVMPEIIQKENASLLKRLQTERAKGNFDALDIADVYPIKATDIHRIHSATCAAASLEFNIADKHPSEFIRYVEGLTSPRKSVNTIMEYEALAPSMKEALNMLIEQKANYKVLDNKNIEVKISPDDNAYLRASVQQSTRQPNTRSVVNVLMQSALMQLGSRNTYNSLTDRRSREVGEGQGLNQFEIAFVESVIDNSCRTVPLIYMEINDDITKITGYTHSFEEIKQHFINSIDLGKNVVTGFLVDVDDSGNIKIPQGHEIIITGYDYDENGTLLFKYNDTDDGAHFAPSWMTAKSFVKKVHHANIPEEALFLNKPPQTQSTGPLYLQNFKYLQHNENIGF